MILYTDDYNGFFPAYQEDPTSSYGAYNGYYQCVVARYCKIPVQSEKQIGGVLHCPEFKPRSVAGELLASHVVYTNFTGVRDNSSNYYVNTTYGGSVAVFSESKVNGVFPQVRKTRIRKPSRTFLMTDGYGHTIRQWNQNFHYRHNNGVNMNFADGHAQTFNDFIMKIPVGTICGQNGSPFKTVMTTIWSDYPWSKTW